MNSISKHIQPLFNSRSSAILLFLTSCIFLFVLPVMKGVELWHFRLCMSLVLLFSILSLEKVKMPVVLSGFVAIVLDWFSELNSGSVLIPFLRLATFVFVFWIVASLMAKFLKQKEVKAYGLLEAINGYLLLGIVFSSLTLFLNTVHPGSYHLQAGEIQFNDMVYYTLITLTTTGYGDVLPYTPGAKNLSMIIAVCGQIYVAFLVGVLVGKYTQQLTGKD